MADYKKLIPIILKYEGGYVYDPLDFGGATNKGITISTFRYVFGEDKTVEDLKNISDKDWELVFKRFYWNKWSADKINNQSIANILVDWVWASGKWGIIKPQEILKVNADGLVGDKTIYALNNYNSQEDLFNKIKEARIVFVNNIVLAHPEQKRFIKGWTNRINSFTYSLGYCNQ